MIVEKLKGTGNSETVNLENSILESGKNKQVNKNNKHIKLHK